MAGAQPKLRIVTNAGGMNPAACARAAARVLEQAGLADTTVGVVSGDEFSAELDRLQGAGEKFVNLDTGLPPDELSNRVGDALRLCAVLAAAGGVVAFLTVRTQRRVGPTVQASVLQPCHDPCLAEAS